jgi:hypothetical protein
MKTVKTTVLSSMLLFALAISFAFVPGLRKSSNKTSITSKKAVVGVWFIYTHAISNWSHAIDPNNYRRLAPGENVFTLCDGSLKLCAILAEPDPNSFDAKPLIPSNSTIYSQLNTYFTFGFGQNPSFVKLKN